MQFESRWEKQQRLKRQKRSGVAGMITAVILVLLLGVAMWNGKRTLEKKNRIYEEQSESLTQQINEQQQRQKELEEYKRDYQDICDKRSIEYFNHNKAIKLRNNLIRVFSLVTVIELLLLIYCIL